MSDHTLHFALGGDGPQPDTFRWARGVAPAGAPCDPGPVEAARRAAAALHEIARWTEQAAAARRALVSAEAELAALHAQLNRLGYTAVGGGA